MCTKKKVWLTQELHSPGSSFVFPQNLIAHIPGCNLSSHVPANTPCAPVGVCELYLVGRDGGYVCLHGQPCCCSEERDHFCSRNENPRNLKACVAEPLDFLVFAPWLFHSDVLPLTFSLFYPHHYTRPARGRVFPGHCWTQSLGRGWTCPLPCKGMMRGQMGNLVGEAGGEACVSHFTEENAVILKPVLPTLKLRALSTLPFCCKTRVSGSRQLILAIKQVFPFSSHFYKCRLRIHTPDS